MDKLTSSLEKIAWEIKYFVDINDVVRKLNDKHKEEMEKKVDVELRKKIAEGMRTVMLEAMKPRMLEEMRAIMLEAVQAEWETLVESSPRLQTVLQHVFEELVQYLLGVFKIFYHPDGRE